MLKRKIYSDLLDWKAKASHKTLVVRGQRQVGKTFIIRQFAKNEYEHLVEFDFSKDKDARLAFDGNLRVDYILNGLMAFHDPEDFVPGKTLLFLDEIQDCPEAWSALKSFTEDGRYDVIASGSRLGLENNLSGNEENCNLAPTGYISSLIMKPLDFEEFLWAAGIKEDMVDTVRRNLRDRERINPAIQKRLTELFRDFMIVGGMPEAVDSFIRTHSYAESYKVLDDLLLTCRQDINRYNRGVDKIKTAECFDSIPNQLSNTNKKFMYSRIDGEGSRKSCEKYGGNLLWIKNAGLGLFCYNLAQPLLPLESNKIKDAFRVYMSDTGILMKMFGLPATAAVRRGDDNYNFGAPVENLIATCLDRCGFPIYYYRKNEGKGKMELDFVIETMQGSVIIEVKSGKDRDAPSINKVKNFFDVDHRVVLENDGYGLDDKGIEHMPLFSAAFFDTLWS